MNDNDILIARKTEGGCRTVKIDGDAADCERVNRRVKDRQKAEECLAKEEAAKKAAKKAQAEADHARRRKRTYLTFGLVLSVAALMTLALAGLMHTVVGMVFIAGDAAAFGWMLGRNQ